MRRIIDIAFLLVLVLGCIALDFYILKRDSAKDTYGPRDYIAQRKDDFNDLLHPPSLAGALPTAIEGWEIAPKSADKMVGATDANREDQAHEIALVKAMAALTKASSDKGEMVGMTMAKGDTRLRVLATLLQAAETLPAGIETLPMPAAVGAAADTAALQAMLEAGDAAAMGQAAVFDVVDGVAFTELPAAGVTGDADIRMIRATLTPALSVTVITQSDDDAAIKEALQAIDFVMLNKLLNTPVEGVEDGRKTDLRGGQPIAVSGTTTAKLPPEVPMFAAGTQGAGLRKPLPEIEMAEQIAAEPKIEPKIAPAESAVFLVPPQEGLGAAKQPCVRRAGVLVCPDG